VKVATVRSSPRNFSDGHEDFHVDHRVPGHPPADTEVHSSSIIPMDVGIVIYWLPARRGGLKVLRVVAGQSRRFWISPRRAAAACSDFVGLLRWTQ
jgi:hypothetical protein